MLFGSLNKSPNPKKYQTQEGNYIYSRTMGFPYLVETSRLGAHSRCHALLLLLPITGIVQVTWTPKICKIMAFMAMIRGSGLLFYILLGFR